MLSRYLNWLLFSFKMHSFCYGSPHLLFFFLRVPLLTGGIIAIKIIIPNPTSSNKTLISNWICSSLLEKCCPSRYEPNPSWRFLDILPIFLLRVSQPSCFISLIQFGFQYGQKKKGNMPFNHQHQYFFFSKSSPYSQTWSLEISCNSSGHIFLFQFFLLYFFHSTSTGKFLIFAGKERSTQ